MTSIHEGLVKDWQRTQLAGYISKSLQIMRLSCSERRLAPLDNWIGQSGLRSLDVLIDGRHGRHAQRVVPNWSPTNHSRNSQHTALYTTTGTALFSDLLGGACEGRGVD